ncbi:MAG: DUF3987 domain-containing protein [Symploca sp. SIO3E6]|nr:DUF3987 domain-containing protein [Caldora sp. SIO3E6]
MLSIGEKFPEGKWLLPFPESPVWGDLPNGQGADVFDWIEDYHLSRHDILSNIGAKPPANTQKVTDRILKIIETLAALELHESEADVQLKSISEEFGWRLPELKKIYSNLSREKGKQEEILHSLPGMDQLHASQEQLRNYPWESIFPKPLASALKTKADASQIDIIFLIQGLLPAVGSLLGAKTGVVMKEGKTEEDHWIENTIIWTALVAPPSSGKSDADRAVLNPLHKIQNKVIERYRERKNELEVLEEEWRGKSSEEKDNLRGSEKDPKMFKQELGKCRKYLVNEGAIEAIKLRISEQAPGKGVLWNRDELAGIFDGLNQYKSGGRGNAKQFLLQSWSGPIFGSVDKVNSDESYSFRGQTLCLSGGLQPSVAERIFSGGKTDGDGMQSRFLPACPEIPENFGQWSDVKADLSGLLSALYNSIEERIPGGLVSLDKDAAEVWHRQYEIYKTGWRHYLEANPSYAYFLGKMCSNMPRIALILHCLEEIFEPKDNFNQMSLATMKRAIWLANYYLGQFRKLQVLFTSSPEEGMSEFLLKILGFCIEKGKICSSDVIHKWRRVNGKVGTLRAAEVKDMFKAIEMAKPDLVHFDGKYLIAKREGASDHIDHKAPIYYPETPATGRVLDCDHVDHKTFASHPKAPVADGFAECDQRDHILITSDHVSNSPDCQQVVTLQNVITKCDQNVINSNPSGTQAGTEESIAVVQNVITKCDQNVIKDDCDEKLTAQEITASTGSKCDHVITPPLVTDEEWDEAWENVGSPQREELKVGYWYTYTGNQESLRKLFLQGRRPWQLIAIKDGRAVLWVAPSRKAHECLPSELKFKKEGQIEDLGYLQQKFPKYFEQRAEQEITPIPLGCVIKGVERIYYALGVDGQVVAASFGFDKFKDAQGLKKQAGFVFSGVTDIEERKGETLSGCRYEVVLFGALEFEAIKKTAQKFFDWKAHIELETEE